MNIILLSGGSGKRLWPLSNDVRSKQFLKLFKVGSEKKGTTHCAAAAAGSPDTTITDSAYESMIERMYRGVISVDKNANIVIATSESQVGAIINQLGPASKDNSNPTGTGKPGTATNGKDRADGGESAALLQTGYSISIEPTRRDTFPAIALATAFMRDVKGVSADEPVVVCPVDPYVDQSYFACLKMLFDQAAKGEANLVLMGIEPTYPSEKYGYIIPSDKQKVSKVQTFKEKPDTKTAESYIAQGALWNGGVFAYKLGYVLDIAEKTFGTADYNKLRENYANLEKISFDYAVAEKEKNIEVLRFSGEWKDLGTWNTLTEAMSEGTMGNVTMAECTNTHIINELEVPIFAMGLKDTVIAASPDGIIVSDKERSAHIKPYVEKIGERPMYEERLWGSYRVLDHQDGSLSKELILKPGKNISYQRHHHRAEVWTFVEGEGVLVTDGLARKVTRGDAVVIEKETLHAIKALTELHIIEVQVGDELVEEDIERFEFDWNKVSI